MQVLAALSNGTEKRTAGGSEAAEASAAQVKQPRLLEQLKRFGGLSMPQNMTGENGLIASVIGTLLAVVLSTGCAAHLQDASPGTNDVTLRLRKVDDAPEALRCGYYAARQVIQYYQPGLADADLKTASLLFARANDTVSILHFLRDNVQIPLSMRNGRVDELLRSLTAGDPVVVFVPVGAFDTGLVNMSGTMMFHAIVVIGYTADETELFFFSDGEGPYAVSRDVFAEQWARVDNLCITRAL